MKKENLRVHQNRKSGELTMINEDSIKEDERAYLTEEEAKTIKEMFKKYLKSYKEKPIGMNDNEWLEQLFRKELPELSDEEIRHDSNEIVKSITSFDENLKSCNKAAEQGISKERWLADKIEKSSTGVAINEYGKSMQFLDDVLYFKNCELEEALTRSVDGHIKMSPNLDGNIAEYMIAKTTELSAAAKGKNISVEVLESHAKNSVDVRAINNNTGKYQNYQLKFGKDAEATIKLIERGNYNNQRIVVPSEQLEEVQAYFREKGSSKTITDHIEAWGVEGQSFTKKEMKSFQEKAQNEGIAPELNYNYYQTKDLAISIGKNASVMALQSAAVTTGFNIAYKIFKGEKIDSDELVEIAIKTGTDTAIKTVTAGTLQVAIRKGIIRFIPKATPAGMIANIACVGIENVKILAKIASGDLSVTKGLDQMGRVTTSMIGGLYGAAKGAAIGASITAWVPVIGPVLAVATGFVGGMVGYFGGSKLGDTIYSASKKIAGAAKTVVKASWNKIKNTSKKIKNKINNIKNKFPRLVF